MRSGSRLAASTLAAALVSCGNYSTDDVAFVEAMPTRDSLRVTLPGSPAQALCGGLGEAKTLIDARQAGQGLNAILDWILAVVDAVRSQEPSRRQRDERRWGPFPDRQHAGVEIQFRMSRVYDVAGAPTYSFWFEARRPGSDPTWASVIDGDFFGASARTGRGTVTLRFPAIWALAIYDPADPPPRYDVPISYDRSLDPRRIGVHITAGDGGQGLVDYTYAFDTWASGHAALDFALVVGAGDRIEEQAHFDPLGAGSASVAFLPAALPGFRYAYSLCWDAAGCVSAISDPGGRSGYPGCVAGTPCVVNWPAGCPAVK